MLPCLWSHRGCIGTAGRNGLWGDEHVQEYLCNLLSSYSHYVSVWLQDIAGNPDVEKRSKRIKMIKYLFKKKKKQRPRKRSLMALCLSAVKSWQQRTHLAKLTVSLSYKKKKIKWKWCKGTSFYLNQMSQFVPKQRSHPGEFAPESTYFIGTDCNSCPKAITVKTWCLRQALSVTGKPNLGSCTCMVLK